MSYLRNPVVEWLLSHGYGQGGTIAVPYGNSPASIISRGPFPPGVSDVLAQAAGNYSALSGSTWEKIDWVFLVGGPGNGKSEALRELAQRLQIDLPQKIPGRPVPRAVPENWQTSPAQLSSGCKVAFVNDASIPRSDSMAGSGPGSLFLDVHDGLKGLAVENVPLALLLNVNRGILVEEANALALANTVYETPLGAASRAIVKWLAEPHETIQPGDIHVEAVVPVDPRTSYYGQLKVVLSATKHLVIHAVFLDVLSLLEPTPRDNGLTISFSTATARPAEYHTFGCLRCTEESRDNTAAGQFLNQVVAESRWTEGACKDASTGQLCDAYGKCPFAQNRKWLSGAALRQRFLDTFRAGEVAAGRRFTYRELLEHLSLAVLGRPEAAWLAGEHPCDWSKHRHQEVQSGSKQAAATLFSHRIYNNLFPAKNVLGTRKALERPREGDTVFRTLRPLLSNDSDSARPQAFERAFGIVDPARDTDSWNRVRTQALDAVEALEVIPPAAQMAQWDFLAPDVHSDIESDFDQCIRDEIATELHAGSRAAANRVRVLRRYRSVALLRQIGLALGYVAYGDAIQSWLAEQENALRNGPLLKLGDGIRRLILPSSEQGRVFLAPLRPRTYCLAEPPKNTILTSIPVNDLDVVIVASGDTLIAEIQINRPRQHQAPLVLATLVVDLAIAREALLHADRVSRSFTEIGDMAFARIERARASLVSRERSANGTVLFTDELQRRFMLLPASGMSPLRVQQVT